MLVRGLPLIAGIAPVAGITLAYWVGVNNDVLPSCIPYLDGCTSVSAAGRYLPGSLLFRSVMLPQSILLVFLWYLAARWLHSIAPSSKAPGAIVVSGVVGALALVLYVTFLGTKAPFYEFMRRFGIYFYFLGTATAQLTLAIALLGHAKRTAARSIRKLAIAMLWLCGLPFALGILNLVLKAVLENPDFTENRIEWNSALLMQGYFIVLYIAWRTTGFSVVVSTD
jgi:ABC-type multidrug transport system permease subunit